jgi:hypothetical protein
MMVFPEPIPGHNDVFPMGEPGPRPATKMAGKKKAPMKLLTKVERAGLLFTAERTGLSLSVVERLGLLSNAW